MIVSKQTRGDIINRERGYGMNRAYRLKAKGSDTGFSPAFAGRTGRITPIALVPASEQGVVVAGAKPEPLRNTVKVQLLGRPSLPPEMGERSDRYIIYAPCQAGVSGESDGMPDLPRQLNQINLGGREI